MLRWRWRCIFVYAIKTDSGVGRRFVPQIVSRWRSEEVVDLLKLIDEVVAIQKRFSVQKFSKDCPQTPKICEWKPELFKKPQQSEPDIKRWVHSPIAES